MIVHGNRDDLVPEASVCKLVGKLSAQKDIRIDYRIVDGANHFFGNHADVLDKHVDDYLDKILGPRVPVAVAE